MLPISWLIEYDLLNQKQAWNDGDAAADERKVEGKNKKEEIEKEKNKKQQVLECRRGSTDFFLVLSKLMLKLRNCYRQSLNVKTIYYIARL